jgi:hypothetical protein
VGELHDLIGIYGGIDWAVMAEEGRRTPVSRLLPLYRDDKVHWYDDFLAWTNEKRGTDEGLVFPMVEDALATLADTPAEGRMRARRLFAVAAALQARPELQPGGERADLAWRALQVPGLADTEEQARRLLAILADDDLLPPPEEHQAPGDLDRSWERMVDEIAAQGLIADAHSLGPRPCTGRLVEVEVRGQEVPVATLTTVWETDRVRFDRATRFLEPSNWPHCCSFWCEMKRGAQVGDVYQYHEIVSTDCGNKAHAWTLEADLDFTFRKDPGVVMADYRLRNGIPQPEVLVDEGSLMVERLGANAASRVRVTTSKRVRFARSFSGEALAMTMCALGYASVVEDLVFTCAALPEEEKGKGKPFPAKAPGNAGPPPGSMVKAIADQVAAAVKDCADECADALDASSKAIAEERYTADALVQDMAGAWVRLLREGATAVDLGVRSAQAARPAPARARPRERPS